MRKALKRLFSRRDYIVNDKIGFGKPFGKNFLFCRNFQEKSAEFP